MGWCLKPREGSTSGKASRVARDHRCLLFDWGDTLMRDITEFDGPMATWPRVQVIPYAHEILRELRPSWTICLATNATASSESDIWAALRRVSLDEVVDKIYCFRRIGYKKPALEFFTYILNDLRMNSAQVIMIGDAFETDVRGANQAGIRAIWFNERSAESRHGLMYDTIHTLRELPQALNRFAL